MWRPILLAICLGCAGCGVAPQPESAKTVAAYEVPLPTAPEKAEFLALVSRAALANGLHLDSASPEELQRLAQDMPEAAMTVHAAVWRGTEDDDSEAVIMDQQDHLGLVWIMFAKGENPNLATRFRQRLMSMVIDRWPETEPLPVMPTGAIPLHKDLRRTPDGYRVEPSAADRYELPASSPLIASN